MYRINVKWDRDSPQSNRCCLYHRVTSHVPSGGDRSAILTSNHAGIVSSGCQHGSDNRDAYLTRSKAEFSRFSNRVQAHSDNGMTLNSVQYLYCSALECSFTQRRRKVSSILFLNATPRDQRTDANYSRLARFHVGAITLQSQFRGS